MLKETVTTCRSYRRFDEAERIPHDLLVDLVDTARIVAASANQQVIKYALFSTPEECAALFPNTAWAGALPDWDGPAEGERPTGYIVLLRDADLVMNDKFTAWDEGIAAQTIMLAATEAGFGGCMIGSFKRKSVTELCQVPGNLEADLVLALGKPVEEVHLVGKREDGSVKYYRDENQVHYVPKRALDEVLVKQ